MSRTGDRTGEYILLGKVTRPHGIRGEIRVHPFSGQPENFLGYREIFLAPVDQEERIPYRIEQSRVQGRQVILRLAGCESRTVAELLAGREVWLRRSDLPEPGEDEFYLADLEGREAVMTDGLPLGRITAILDSPAHPILVVTGRDREYLVPVHRGIVVSIDEEQVVLSPPPGLLDINDR
ncbi:MAG: 16S rRNA processing protein RimM [Desulfobulbus sp.]|nr:MAG: 16S rRNA processing protein RimM [Desulfobulbus sp.]